MLIVPLVNLLNTELQGIELLFQRQETESHGLEERLGIESAEGKKYKAERQAGIIGTSQLI